MINFMYHWEPIAPILLPVETETQVRLLLDSAMWNNFKQNGEKDDCRSLWFLYDVYAYLTSYKNVNMWKQIADTVC